MNFISHHRVSVKRVKKAHLCNMHTVLLSSGISHEPNTVCNVYLWLPRPLRKWIEERQGLEQQAMPASQFTAKGRRRGKAKDMQRRQGAPGPDGDAPTTRESHVRSSRQSHAAKNLGEQFSSMSGAQAVQHGKQVKILVRLLFRGCLMAQLHAEYLRNRSASAVMYAASLRVQSCGFLKLIVRGFLRVLWFPPLLHWLIVQLIK